MLTATSDSEPYQVEQVNRGEPWPRFYRGNTDARRYESVTELLEFIGKPGLIKWSANTERELCIEAAADLYLELPDYGAKMSRPAYITTLQKRIGTTKAHVRESRKALELGAGVHKKIEALISRQLGRPVKREPELRGKALLAYESVERWWTASGLKPVWTEQKVWSRTHGYAGTFDLMCRSDELELIDFKTSKDIYPESFLQAAAYAAAANEMGHGPVKRARIVRPPKSEDDELFKLDLPIQVVVLEEADLAEYFRLFLHQMEVGKWCISRDEEYWTKRKAAEAAAKAKAA